MSDEGKLTGHSALIAGASGSIGMAVARILAAEGCQLHLADVNDEPLDQFCDDLAAKYGIEAEIYSTDLSDSINAAALALECEDVNILINSFGAVPDGDIETLDAEDWVAAFELRLFGAINLSREVIEGMNNLGSGIIVNVGSKLTDEEEIQLCGKTVNAALQSFSENLDKASKRQGIRVLTYLPQSILSIDEQAGALAQMIFRKMSS